MVKEKIVCLLSALTLFSAVSSAQVTASVEYPYKEYKDVYTIPMGEKGVLQQMFEKDTHGGKRWVKMLHYDKNLKLLTADSVEIDKGLYFNESKMDNEMCYTMLRDGSDFSIVAYNTVTRKISVLDGEYKRKASMRDFTIGGGYLVFSSTQNKLDRIGIVNLKTGESCTLDMHLKGVRDKDIYVMETSIIDNEVNALVRVGRDVLLMRFGMDGTQKNIIWLTENIEEAIISASIQKSAGRYFVTGTYTTGKRAVAQGFYFAQLDGEKFKFIKFYNFLDLKNFTEFMSDKAKAKVERKKQKAEEKGKELTMNYLITSHDVIEEKGNFYYIAESYYPVYYGGGPGQGRVFAGYYYTHAILIKFDSKGNILWDNCFPMNPSYKPLTLKHFISASLSGNNLNAIFTDTKKMVSKSFNKVNGTVTQDRTEEMIKTGNDDEDIKKAFTNSDYWYGKNFLLYGNRVVKNKATNDRRRVFFLNKYTTK